MSSRYAEGFSSSGTIIPSFSTTQVNKQQLGKITFLWSKLDWILMELLKIIWPSACVETRIENPFKNHQHWKMTAEGEICSNFIEVRAFFFEFFFSLNVTWCILGEWIESYLTLHEVLPLPLQVSERKHTKSKTRHSILTTSSYSLKWQTKMNQNFVQKSSRVRAVSCN
jgi:hypothetical protein